jgi:hypothetical protein
MLGDHLCSFAALPFLRTQVALTGSMSCSVVGVERYGLARGPRQSLRKQKIPTTPVVGIFLKIV